jgi:hypothetical protein
MRFRGGGIGHKSTRDWDELLQSERGGVQDPMHDDTRAEEGSERTEQVAHEEIEEEEPDEEQLGEEPEDDTGEVEGNMEVGEDDEIELDRVIADDGEELDEDVWAREGYGTL